AIAPVPDTVDTSTAEDPDTMADAQQAHNPISETIGDVTIENTGTLTHSEQNASSINPVVAPKSLIPRKRGRSMYSPSEELDEGQKRHKDHDSSHEELELEFADLAIDSVLDEGEGHDEEDKEVDISGRD
ncbi:hypothetical protein CPB97_001930, partial [Podila verticillata]